ncbi:glutathione S-transferase kappa 1 [Echria macrotheca]|uniref:Glutathione S-transferase kappa 1 n=1 Tax=Echria macrotheca TaxID=438768 RepID=A0AAJ0FCG9_9PEZI|nr:glutathione S-transferase kappa 1 [Echria macrotheca]
MAMAHTILPLRALHYIKRAYPSRFETAFHYLFYQFWSPGNLNLTRPENLIKALSEVSVGFKGHDGNGSKTKLFSADEVKAIMAGAGSQEMKDALKAATQQALEHGAFGAPWFWANNDKGKSEPFFGSDRFHFLYKFLDLPFQDVALLPPKLGTEKSKL